MSQKLNRLFLVLVIISIAATFYKLGLSEKSSNPGSQILQQSLHKLAGSYVNTTNSRSEDEIYMRALRKSDIPLLEAVTKLNVSNFKDADAQEMYQKIVTKPLQGVCKIMKRIGGFWIRNLKAVDGDKFVCFDDTNIYDQKKNCLIYSFGVNYDWTFEDQMDVFGCSVFAFDPTVNMPRNRGKGIIFEKLGIAAKDDIAKSKYKVDTLANILNRNNHTHSVIHYLKVDVEGSELEGMDDWLSSGALDNVEQLALEMHTKHRNGTQFKKHIETVQELYRLGFRIVSYEPNTAMGRMGTSYYPLFEVVFMKDNKWNHLDLQIGEIVGGYTK